MGGGARAPTGPPYSYGYDVGYANQFYHFSMDLLAIKNYKAAKRDMNPELSRFRQCCIPRKQKYVRYFVHQIDQIPFHLNMVSFLHYHLRVNLIVFFP